MGEATSKAAIIGKPANQYPVWSLQAVGASGAIFGMVGAWGAFCLMNETVLGRNNSQRALRNVAQTVMINVVYGMSSSQIDNMGHLGVSFDGLP